MIRALAAAACALTLGAGAAAEACETPVGRDFPAAPPDRMLMSATRLLALNDELDTGRYDIRALLVARDCQLLFERYKGGVTRDHNHTVYSITKSVTATLAGILLHQGKLASLDTPVAAVLVKPFSMSPADWQKAEKITLRQAMQMSSGLAYRHDAVRHPIYRLDVDRLAIALSVRHTLPPGKLFNYSDGDASISGAAIAGAAGESLYAFARRALFNPLAMANHAWPYTDAAGRAPGGWGLRLRPMDMVKLGQLYLQRGEWNGQRLFAAEFVAQAWAAGPNPTYALHWWRGDPGLARGRAYYYAAGFKGQRLIVIPSLNLVAALAASLPNEEGRIVERHLIQALVEGAENTEADSAAHAALARRQREPFRGETRVEQQEQDRPQL